jgi:predicted nucleic acid-binding protein
MSAGKPFFDSNVLLYIVTTDAKAEKAEILLEAGGVISVQVLNEFASVASRKWKLAWSGVREALELIRERCEVVPLTLEIHESGLVIAERYGFSVYDSLILAAAAHAKCRLVYSEDMQHGQVVQGVTIRNPF